MKQMFHSETPRIQPEVLFSQECQERDGVYLRNVSLMPKTLEWVLHVGEKMQQVRNFLPREAPFSPLTEDKNTVFLVDDVGILMHSPFDSDTAHVHVTFWDGKFRGREVLCRRAAVWCMAMTGHRLMTAIPTELRAVIAFAKRIGFGEEVQVHRTTILWFDPLRGGTYGH